MVTRTTSRLLAALALVATAAAPLAAQGEAARIDSVLKSFAEAGRFNGAALVASGGRIAYQGAYGGVDREGGARLSAETPFRIASVTKAFTSLLVMQMVQEGKLRLDEPIATYLPNFRRDTGGRITVRHLLTHRSGLPHDQGVASEQYRPDSLLSADLIAEPGATFQYNNRDYYLLARIVERVSGRSWDDLLRERVLAPAGMGQTATNPDAASLTGIAMGYEGSDSAGWRRPTELDFRNYLGAASMVSTVGDLYRFDRALADGRLLQPALRDTMYAPGPGAAAFGSWVYARPFPNGRTLTLVDRRGDLGGYGAWFLRIPTDDGALILLDNNAGAALQEIGEAILKVMYGTPPTPQLTS